MSIDNVSGTSSNTGNVNGSKRAAGSGATETGQSVKGSSNLGKGNTGNVNGSKRAAGSGATETGQSVKGSSNLGKDEFLKLLVPLTLSMLMLYSAH